MGRQLRMTNAEIPGGRPSGAAAFLAPRYAATTSAAISHYSPSWDWAPSSVRLQATGMVIIHSIRHRSSASRRRAELLRWGTLSQRRATTRR